MQTFLNSVVESMESRKTTDGTIAKYINKVADHDDVANRIAIARHQLATERSRNMEMAKLGAETAELPFKPEVLLSFTQRVMNQACWAARRVLRSGQAEDMGTGIDFSQDVAEQAAGLESAARELVECTLMDDFQTLNNLHNFLQSKMSYLDNVEPLFLFAESVKVEDGVYEPVNQLMDFDDVMSMLDERSLEIQEKQEAEDYKEAADTNFSDFSKAA
jgi:hypothetical protein